MSSFDLQKKKKIISLVIRLDGERLEKNFSKAGSKIISIPQSSLGITSQL